MAEQNGRFHVQAAADIELAQPAGLQAHADGLRRAQLIGRGVGSVHTGFDLCSLAAGGRVDMHLHSTEQSFYVLSGGPQLTLGRDAYQLVPGDCGLLPVGVPHAWRSDRADAMWAEVSSPTPRVGDPPDTFWTTAPANSADVRPLDIRDPRSRTFFRLGPGEMEVANLKVGAAVDAPTVSASMATALLVYSGIAVKMLVDQRLGAVLHTMFMVEYQPGGVAQPHDHPFEETYYMLEGEVDAVADGQTFKLSAGDIFWTGVGCIHAFDNNSGGRVRFLETQSPSRPGKYSYRFNRDWEYLAQQLA